MGRTSSWSFCNCPALSLTPLLFRRGAVTSGNQIIANPDKEESAVWDHLSLDNEWPSTCGNCRPDLSNGLYVMATIPPSFSACALLSKIGTRWADIQNFEICLKSQCKLIISFHILYSILFSYRFKRRFLSFELNPFTETLKKKYSGHSFQVSWIDSL